MTIFSPQFILSNIRNTLSRMLVHYTRHSNVELNELIQKTPSWHAPPSWNRHEMTRRWYASVFRKPCFDLFKFDAEDSKRTEMLIGLDGCIFSDLPMLAQARSKCYSIYSSHSQELLMFNADARTDTHFLWKACLHGQIPSSSFCLNSSKHTAQICGRKTRTVWWNDVAQTRFPDASAEKSAEHSGSLSVLDVIGVDGRTVH